VDEIDHTSQTIAALRRFVPVRVKNPHPEIGLLRWLQQ
jgi:hypothetical protein